MIQIKCGICGKLIKQIASVGNLYVSENINCDQCMNEASEVNYLKGQNDTLKKQMVFHSVSCNGGCGTHGGSCTTCKTKH